MHTRLQKVRMLRRLRRRQVARSFVRDERGIQLAELAIVLPILLILFGATAEFGRFFYEYSTLAKATRVGARYLITTPINETEKAKARNLVVYGNPDGTGDPVVEGLTTDNIVITARNSAGDAIVAGVPATITVEISGFQHQSFVSLGDLIKNEDLSLNIDVKPSVTMRYLINSTLV
ncbi:MAG TPA: TadE family protein [Pyrinomonadaceae bacterium]|nr:TadE family protein [Pyrinomonadaceae bacterium]